jgi:hypothetical protein
MKQQKKQWPNRLRNAGIGVTIPGIVLFVLGLVLYIIALGTYYETHSFEHWTALFAWGIALIAISWSALLPEGIAMWIVGGVFVHKYKKA